MLGSLFAAMSEEKLTAEIIKASKAVKKKQLALKMGRSAEQDFFEKQFKPITKPLGELLKSQISIVKHEPKLEQLSQPSSPIPSPKRKTPTSKTVPITEKSLADELGVIGYDPLTEDENEQIQTERSFQQFREEYQNMIEQQPEIVDDFLEQYHMLPRVYIDGLLSDITGEYDTTTGPHFDPIENKLKLGNALIEIEGKDILINDIRYKGTAGLYELIFKNKPTGFNKEDQDRYKDILQRTSVHHREYDPNQQIRGSKSHKYTNVIRPLTFRKRASTVSGFGSVPNFFTKKQNTALKKEAFGTNMIYSQTPYQFVYWDDINELVDRLKLLIASQQAGHTGHTNEISSIVEELKEAGVI